MTSTEKGEIERINIFQNNDTFHIIYSNNKLMDTVMDREGNALNGGSLEITLTIL